MSHPVQVRILFLPSQSDSSHFSELFALAFETPPARALKKTYSVPWKISPYMFNCHLFRHGEGETGFVLARHTKVEGVVQSLPEIFFWSWTADRYVLCFSRVVSSFI